MTYCEHVYKITSARVCKECGGDTHETDWAEVAQARRDWIAAGKADWSVCPDCGGTIRGWWSI